MSKKSKYYYQKQYEKKRFFVLHHKKEIIRHLNGAVHTTPKMRELAQVARNYCGYSQKTWAWDIMWVLRNFMIKHNL